MSQKSPFYRIARIAVLPVLFICFYMAYFQFQGEIWQEGADLLNFTLIGSGLWIYGL